MAMSPILKKNLAITAAAKVPTPAAATYLPRPGGLASATLFVLYSQHPNALPASLVEERVKKLAWSEGVSSARRMATVLGQLRTAGLIENGEPTSSMETSGPRWLKTWRWKLVKAKGVSKGNAKGGRRGKR